LAQADEERPMSIRHAPSALLPRSNDDAGEELRSEAGVRRAWIAYGPELRRYAAHRLRDRHRAEDVVQETFLRAWRSADRFDPARGSMRVWLFAILRNLLVDMARTQARRPQTCDHVSDVEGPDGIDARLSSLVVAEALTQLTAEHRAVVVANYLEQRPHAEIAQWLRVPIGTVRSRLFYARKALGAALDDENPSTSRSCDSTSTTERQTT
jgi:RNA polymerase sigma-70 factor (ECF subfamily)